MQICAMTSKGINKNKNDDSVLVNNYVLKNEYFTVNSDDCNLLIAIADGVGGNNAGDIASNMAVEGIKVLFDCKVIDEKVIFNKITEINNNIINKSNQDFKLFKMATTLSGLYIIGDNVWIFHVGNSRVYTMNGEYLKQLTEDHTTVNWLIKTGVITQQEAENHNKRNEITNCLGGGNKKLLEALCISKESRSVKNARKIIITSDGVHEYVGIDDLEIIINNEMSGQKICEKIVSKALKNGSCDDISIIFMQVYN